MSFYQFLNAIKDGDLENVEKIYQQEYLESSETYNRGPLHYACFYGSHDIVKFLLDKGIDFNTCTVFDWRPIHFACYRGNADIVKELCNFGCDILTKGKFGETPRDLALENKHHECIRVIDDALAMQENIREFTINCSLNNEEDLRPTPKFQKGFIKLETLGRGGFGKVVRYLDPNTGNSYAIKTLYSSDSGKNDFERNILLYKNRLNHHRIIKYFDIQIETDKIKVMMEYMEKGTLAKYIENNGALSHNQTATFCKQILEGLAFLHYNSIIHRDIKSGNILLDKFTCKLSDFGLSRCLKTIFGSKYASTCCGTYRYMAPELIDQKRYSYPADIWSVGATFIEMVSGKIPYWEFSEIEASQIISRTKEIGFIPATPLSNNMKTFLLSTQGEPSTRSSAVNLLKSPFIVWGF